MLQSRTGTGWKRSPVRQQETFDSVFTDDLPIDSTRFWLTKHIH